MSHLLGFLVNDLSTLSVDILKEGASVIKLSSKICEGNNGINLKNNDDIAKVNMFP